MRKGPLIPTLALAGGIVVSCSLVLPWWSGSFLIIIAIGLASHLLSVSKNPVTAFRKGKWHLLWVILLFLGIGITDEALSRPLTIEKAFASNCPDSLYCEVTEVLTKTYGERIDAVIEGTNGAKVRIRSSATDIAAGDIIRIPAGKLKETAADTTEIGRRIQPIFKSAGILYTAKMLPGNFCIVGKSLSPRYFFIRLRVNIEQCIERSHLSKSAVDFLCAILLGDNTGLDENTRLAFSNGGLAHMLALSGLHIGIIAGFIILMMWPLKYIGRYKMSYVFAIIILWLYVAVTGMSYSSVRACVMASFAFIGILAERKNFGCNALYSACLLILIVDPNALFDAGFQLSVVCVWALIMFASRLNPISHRLHPMLYSICGALIATIVATAASWVLTSYYFSQIPLMFLPSNLLLLPVFPFYLSSAIVFVALLCLGWEIQWLRLFLDYGYGVMIRTTEFLSGGSEFVINYQIPLWGVVAWLVFIASFAYFIKRKETK